MSQEATPASSAGTGAAASNERKQKATISKWQRRMTVIISNMNAYEQTCNAPAHRRQAASAKKTSPGQATKILVARIMSRASKILATFRSLVHVRAASRLIGGSNLNFVDEPIKSHELHPLAAQLAHKGGL